MKHIPPWSDNVTKMDSFKHAKKEKEKEPTRYYYVRDGQVRCGIIKATVELNITWETFSPRPADYYKLIATMFGFNADEVAVDIRPSGVYHLVGDVILAKEDLHTSIQEAAHAEYIRLLDGEDL